MPPLAPNPCARTVASSDQCVVRLRRRAGVFSDTVDPQAWVTSGLTKYVNNCQKDVYDVIRVWAPADLLCFSVPLWLRLPVRHVVSFVRASLARRAQQLCNRPPLRFAADAQH